MAEFDIDGVRYVSTTLDGSVQMKVMKRLLPIFTAIVGRAKIIKAAAEKNAEERADMAEAGAALDESAADAIHRQMSDRMADAVMPVSREMAALTDEAEDFIVHSCFAVTEWRDEMGRFHPVMPKDGVVMHAEMHRRNQSIVVRTRIAMQVLAESFTADFAKYGIDIQKLMTDAGARR